MKCYKTIKNAAVTEFTEKKSRFIGYIAPVKTEAEALEFVNGIKKKHPDARHNVYAYIVRENNITRFSDDGEPSGTAGMPVLDVLQKKGLTDVAIVVTRYFGGILLGGGGLVRAYSKSASDAVGEGVPVKMIYSSVYNIKTEYHFFGKIEYELRKLCLEPENTEYDASVSFNVCVTDEDAKTMEKRLTEATGGSVRIKKVDERYVAYDGEDD